MRVPRRLALLIMVCAVPAVAACYRRAPVPGNSSFSVIVTPEPTQGPPKETVPVVEPQTKAPEATPTVVAPPSPAFPGSSVGTPTPNPTPDGYDPSKGMETYVVQYGQTLGWIAARFGSTVEEIVAANGLADPNSVSAGQTILVPVSPSRTSPALKLVPDSEMVYGPAYIHFDLADFVAEQGGYLASYAEKVEGRILTGTEIIQFVSQRYSVGPRVFLALLELQSGWVTQKHPNAGSLAYPLGYVRGYYEGLYQQLEWAAVQLNEGYYGWKWGWQVTVRLGEGTRAAIAPELNPGTAGVQNFLAGIASSWDEWMWSIGPDGFVAAYEQLFGDPFAYAIEPLVPPDLVQPDLQLPWESGDTWYLTSGPHGLGYGKRGGDAALDFAPSGGHLGCAPSAGWVAAAADGLVVRSENGEVLLDLDGDGYEQSGWVLYYLHVDGAYRVEAGTYLQQGERVGHASCEGGYSEATHLHFARRYNGEWIPAGRDRLPMVLSGWTAHAGKAPYEGTMTRGDEVRADCECWKDDYNGLFADGGR